MEAIDRSQHAWEALERAHGSTYWYQEVSCGGGSDGSNVTIVQVTDGTPAIVSQTFEQNGQCSDAAPFRYEALGPVSIPDLIAECRDLVEKGMDADFVIDDDGVLSSCKATRAKCKDACDYGFAIFDRGFGTRAQ